MRRWQFLYYAALVVAGAAALFKALSGGDAGGHLVWIGILFAAGLIGGWLTFACAKSRMRGVVKTVVVAVVAYHALFGPVMLAYFASVDAQRNDDLPLQLYPHVVAFVNSFE